jgi:uncharacterized delta-60 repeat protein
LEDRCLLNAGALDTTFGNGAGYVTTALTSGGDRAYSVLVQTDGKLIATGTANAGISLESGLARYNSDGSLDTGFGIGGEVLNSTSLPAGDAPMAALYPTTGTANDGKIVLAQFSKNFSVARYNPNGTLDTAFGSNGTATASFGSTLGTLGSSWAVIQPDGKIDVVGASSDNKTLELARFNTDGSLDTTFGQGGLVTTSLANNGTAEHAASGQTLLLQSNGGLIVSMDASGGGISGYHWDLIGYNADGSLNTSFGSGGFVRQQPASSGDFSQGIETAALYPTAGTANDGKIVMVGTGSPVSGQPLEWLVRRYNTNGTLDSTFGNGGTVFTSGAPYYAFGVVIQPDGKIVTSGRSATAQAVERFNSDGSLDSTFGTGGIVTTSIGTSNNQGWDAALQSNGDIVVAGFAPSGSKINFTVTRYLGDSPSFTVSGFPLSITAGTSGTFTVTARNADGSTNTNYTGTVHFTSSDPHAVLPADYTFTASDQGMHTFSATLVTAGSQAIVATDTMTSTTFGGDVGITVNPAAASTLVVSGFPTSITQGTAGTFTVTALDPYGNIATGYTGTVKFNSSDPLASLPANYTFTAADAGVHTFSATLNTVGTESLTATDTLNSSITGIETGIAVQKKHGH